MIGRFILALISLLFVAAAGWWLFADRPDYAAVAGEIQPLDIPLAELDGWVAAREALVADLRPDNQACVRWWADTIGRTEWSVVFLHGFSAGPRGGDPIIGEIADELEANVYLARLADHGRSSIESFAELTPVWWVESARQAVAVGNLLGENVLVVGSSTGCPIALYLAAKQPEIIDALMLYSPNIEVKSSLSEVALLPGGLSLMRLAFGGKYRAIELQPEAKPYWTTKYRLEGIVAMKHLLEMTTDPAVFTQVRQPTLVSFYEKNEEEQDQVISVTAARRMFDQLGTPDSLKQLEPLASVGGHIMLSDLQTKDLSEVRRSARRFARWLRK